MPFPYEERDDIKLAATALNSHLSRYNRGDLVTYEECAEVCGFAYRTPEFEQVARKVMARILVERRIRVVRDDPRSVGVGLLFLTEADQVAYGSTRRVKRASSQLRRGIKELENCTDENLDDQQKRMRILSHDAMKQEVKNLRAAIPKRD